MEEDSITLNVGGSLYTTTIATLTRYPDSMLGAMFSGRVPTNRDAHGNFTIDGDGPIFRYVLNFLRRSALCVPDDFAEWDLLTVEADYYQIKELIDALALAMASLKKERAVKPKSHKEMEFIEIVTKSSSGEFTYCGSHETIQEIPLLYGFYQAHANSANNVLRRVKRDGEVTARHGVVAPNRMKIFQEISQIGFGLINKSSFGELNGSERWLFGRNNTHGTYLS